MAKSKLTSGMWRIDPQKWSRVIDRCGQPVASVEADVDSNTNASLIAAAPDMFELLRNSGERCLHSRSCAGRDSVGSSPRPRRFWFRGFFPQCVPGTCASRTQEWLKFMEGLWKSDGDPQRIASPTLSLDRSLSRIRRML